MLFHDVGGPYAVAAERAATRARAHIEEIIARGQSKAAAVIDAVQTNQPRDVIKPASALAGAWRVTPQDNAPSVIELGQNGNTWSLHPHAQQQAAQRVNLPNTYLRSLLDDGSGWAAELAQNTLRELYTHRLGDARLLLRALQSENGWQVRGLLSDRYRRLDSRPIFDAFCGAAQTVGLVPVDGICCETKVALKALYPAVFEPVEHEVIAFGLQLRNSDYGDGKLQLAIFMLRLWCTNFAISCDELSKVHLGARLPDDLRLSEETYRLDTEANASAIHDLAGNALAPARIEALCDVIKESAKEKVSPAQARRLISAKLNKGEAEQAMTLFEGDNADNDAVPSGAPTRYKLSQAVGWLAHNATPDRKLELQALSGELSGIAKAA